MIGASIGLLAVHDGQRALHSHVTGLLAPARKAGAGRAMKLHQRQWCRSHDISTITWTFDPLVRRNAWFNIAVLGADVHSYLPDFYGTMDDAINSGDESDRLYVVWDATMDLPTAPRDGGGIDAIATVPTPEDIVALRRSDPSAVRDWRRRTRRRLVDALDAGRRIVGFTRDGHYVIGDPS
jgi:predicted GNAT superfamily acetyltransferase